MKTTAEGIFKGNLLIAEFMGATIDPKTEKSLDPTYVFPVAPSYFKDGINYLKYSKSWFNPESDFKDVSQRYDNSWNWLIPACWKWDNMVDQEKKYKKIITQSTRLQYQDHCDSLDNTASCYEIEYVFEQLCKNIEWLNGLKNKTNGK